MPQSNRHPARDLLSRYNAIRAAAWTHRTELAGPRHLADEASVQVQLKASQSEVLRRAAVPHRLAQPAANYHLLLK